MRRLAVSLLVAAAMPGVAVAQPRAVVELFTSQGCSSCPPADRLVAEWAKDPTLVALSWPVDYWDYLGWKDTLARHDFSARQRAYAQGRGDRDIYTPQLVINGLAHGVGSDRAMAEKAMAETASTGRVLSVPVTVTSGPQGYSVALGAGGDAGEIWLVPVESKALVTIERGENSGTTVTYSNVVRAARKLGDYTGAALTLTLARADVAAPNADGFAILVQKVDQGRPGAMLGAALEHPPAVD